MIIKGNKLAIITKPKTVHFDLTNIFDNNLKYEVEFIIKHKNLLAEHELKTRLVDYCPNIIMETISMNTENS